MSWSCGGDGVSAESDGAGEWRCREGLCRDSPVGRCAFGIDRAEYKDASDAELLSSAGERYAGYGLPWFNNAPAPGAIRHNYYGFPDENYLQTNDDIMTLKVEHEFSPNLNLHMIARAANYPRQAQITEPQICSNGRRVCRWVEWLGQRLRRRCRHRR